MKPKTTYEKENNGKKTNWKVASVVLGATCVLIAIIALVLPGSIPDDGDLVCYQCAMQDKPRHIAEQLTAQGWHLYILGGDVCLHCENLLLEFGDAVEYLEITDCGIADQGYRFENLSEAEAAYNWLYTNGSMIKVTNLTYENLTIRYNGYGILGYSNRNAECAALNMSGYPTWIAPNGTQVVGYRSLDVIAGWLD